MQWKTVILDSDNWALGASDIKAVLHWAIKDKPWLVVRTFGFNSSAPSTPVQLKSLNWKDAEINSGAEPDRSKQLLGLLMSARIKVFTELHYRLRASRENLGIDDTDESIVQLHQYLASFGIIPGEHTPDSRIEYENRIKLLGDLEKIKTKIIDQALAAKSKEEFDAVRTEMERMFFTNILL